MAKTIIRRIVLLLSEVFRSGEGGVTILRSRKGSSRVMDSLGEVPEGSSSRAGLSSIFPPKPIAPDQLWAEKFKGELVCLPRDGKRYIGEAFMDRMVRKLGRGNGHKIYYAILIERVPGEPESRIKAYWWQDKKRLRLVTPEEQVTARLLGKSFIGGLK